MQPFFNQSLNCAIKTRFRQLVQGPILVSEAKTSFSKAETSTNFIFAYFIGGYKFLKSYNWTQVLANFVLGTLL